MSRPRRRRALPFAATLRDGLAGRARADEPRALLIRARAFGGNPDAAGMAPSSSAQRRLVLEARITRMVAGSLVSGYDEEGEARNPEIKLWQIAPRPAFRLPITAG